MKKRSSHRVARVPVNPEALCSRDENSGRLFSIDLGKARKLASSKKISEREFILQSPPEVRTRYAEAGL